VAIGGDGHGAVVEALLPLGESHGSCEPGAVGR
jgi:hypothetical protein